MHHFTVKKDLHAAVCGPVPDIAAGYLFLFCRQVGLCRAGARAVFQPFFAAASFVLRVDGGYAFPACAGQAQSGAGLKEAV